MWWTSSTGTNRPCFKHSSQSGCFLNVACPDLSPLAAVTFVSVVASGEVVVVLLHQLLVRSGSTVRRPQRSSLASLDTGRDVSASLACLPPPLLHNKSPGGSVSFRACCVSSCSLSLILYYHICESLILLQSVATCGEFRFQMMIGSSGSVTCLSALLCQRYTVVRSA
jgi:hypothetical protein